MRRNRPDPAYVGTLSFHLPDGESVGKETCRGKRDAKEHAAHLAVHYGEQIQIRTDNDRFLDVVDETYLDTLADA